MANKTIAHVETRPDSPFAVAIDVSGHQLVGDEQTANGGANLGPSPFDLLTAALGACTAMTIRWYADKHTWPLDHVSVDVQHGKKIRAGSGAVVDEFRVKMAITGGDLTPEQRQKLFEIAEECPVHKALTGNVAIIMNPQDGPAPA